MRNPDIIFTFLTVASLLLATSCSRQTSPASTEDDGTEQGSAGVTLKTPGLTLSLPELSISSSEKKHLKQFIEEGVEQPLDNERVTPTTIIETARRYLGVPHCMGGKTMKCIDCSGLVAVVFATNGITLPHSSEEQARHGKIIEERKDLKKGDMVFFIRTYKTSRFITHSGIYMGDNKFIHTSTSLGVTVTSLDDPWWSERYIFATRVFDSR